MDILDLSATTATNIFFTTSGTINFLQEAIQQSSAAAIQAQIGNVYGATAVYTLYGMGSSTGGGNTTIGSGAVFCNGEVFIVPAQTFPNPAGGDVVIANLGITNTFLEPDGSFCDPALFSDTVSRNVHNIRSVTFTTGPSGSGELNGGPDFANDYSNFIYIRNIVFWNTPVLTTDWSAGPVTPAYKRDNQQMVFFRGVVEVTGGAATTIFYILPAIFRPVQQTNSLGKYYNAIDFTNTILEIIIDPSTGHMSFIVPAGKTMGPGDLITLDNVYFSTI